MPQTNCMLVNAVFPRKRWQIICMQLAPASSARTLLKYCATSSALLWRLKKERDDISWWENGLAVLSTHSLTNSLYVSRSPGAQINSGRTFWKLPKCTSRFLAQFSLPQASAVPAIVNILPLQCLSMPVKLWVENTESLPLYPRGPDWSKCSCLPCLFSFSLFMPVHAFYVWEISWYFFSFLQTQLKWHQLHVDII